MKPLALVTGAPLLSLACVLALAAAHPLAAERGRGLVAPLEARLDSIVNRAIRDGATPGAALAIGHADDEPEIRVYGRTDWDESAPRVTPGTLYDLASLTKVVATTPAAMLLVQQGRLELDAPVTRYLDWWPTTGARAEITVRQLLLHTSGLPAGDDLWNVPGSREDRLRRIASLPLIARPGEVTEYSDLGMILLGAVVESITHERLDAFVQGHLFRPLMLADTRYLPLRPEDGSPVPLDRIAPTEWAGSRGHLQGDVDDGNARALDGVAGHAGLFSSIRDLARFSRMVLRATEGESTEVLSASLIRSFAAHRPDGGRALGWDGAGTSSWGRYFSPVSFGHNGYTGTSIWIDPARDVYVVLLTNRVDPSAENQKHLALRRAISLAVRDDSPIRLAVASSGAGYSDIFAAQVAAARTVLRAPAISLRRVAASLRAQSSHAHAARRSSHAARRHRASAHGARGHRGSHRASHRGVRHERVARHRSRHRHHR